MIEDEELINALSETKLLITSLNSTLEECNERYRSCKAIYEDIVKIKQDTTAIDTITLKQIQSDITTLFANTEETDREVNILSDELQQSQEQIEEAVSIMKEYNTSLMNTVEKLMESSMNQEEDDDYDEEEDDDNEPSEIVNSNYSKLSSKYDSITLDEDESMSYTKPVCIKIEDHHIFASTWKQLLKLTFLYLEESYENVYNYSSIVEKYYQDSLGHLYFHEGDYYSDNKKYTYLEDYDLCILNGGADVTIKELKCFCDFYGLEPENITIFYE